MKNSDREFEVPTNDVGNVNAHDMYKSLAADEPENSFDLATITPSGNALVATADASPSAVARRARERKEVLSTTLDSLEELKAMMKEQRVLNEQQKAINEQLKQHIESCWTGKLAALSPSNVFASYVPKLTLKSMYIKDKSLNAIIFNDQPSASELLHRGTATLTRADIEELRKENKPYVIHIYTWSPTVQKFIDLRRKALSCLTTAQLRALNFLLHTDTLYCTSGGRRGNFFANNADNVPAELREEVDMLD
ncbi:hypothetical protein DXG03_005725 [Asterophora parasitica]|uniref:Uncharacterized protein n=1 Tax=Asterophora parasitica TaxID=117018 RepID=A0A9P7G7M6_9AGAR|nr:hypothetical protein DXG03_005725 [Asterophora parasitica]